MLRRHRKTIIGLGLLAVAVALNAWLYYFLFVLRDNGVPRLDEVMSVGEEERTIPLRVLFADGKPAAGARLVLFADHRSWFESAWEEHDGVTCLDFASADPKPSWYTRKALSEERILRSDSHGNLTIRVKGAICIELFPLAEYMNEYDPNPYIDYKKYCDALKIERLRISKTAGERTDVILPRSTGQCAITALDSGATSWPVTFSLPLRRVYFPDNDQQIFWKDPSIVTGPVEKGKTYSVPIPATSSVYPNRDGLERWPKAL